MRRKSPLDFSGAGTKPGGIKALWAKEIFRC